MFKFLIKARNAFKHIKLPFRLKSKLHDDFHCTGGQLFRREISELTTKGASKNEIIEKFSGKKISELSEQELKEYGEWIDRNISQINELDNSFNTVIPSLFRQKYYRGVFTSRAEIQTLKKGDIFTDYGYSWYTPKKSYAKDFSNGNNGIIIETIIPCGAKISRDINISFTDGIYGLNPLSSMNIVLPRNVKYQVLDRGIKNNRAYIKLKYLGI